MKDSDRRLKQDIVNLPNCLSKLVSLTPRQFRLIDSPADLLAGFIAQEYVTVFPEYTLVNGDDGEVELGTNFPWQVDWEFLTPYMVGAIKELKATNDSQTSLISTAQSNITTLQSAVAAIPSVASLGTRIDATLANVDAAATTVAKTVGTVSITGAGKWMVYAKIAVDPKTVLTLTQTSISISTTTNAHNVKPMVRDYFTSIGGNERHIASNPFHITTVGAQDVYVVLSVVYTTLGAVPATIAASSEFYAVKVGL